MTSSTQGIILGSDKTLADLWNMVKYMSDHKLTGKIELHFAHGSLKHAVRVEHLF